MLTAEQGRKLRQTQEHELMLQERIRLDEMTRLAKLEHIKRIENALVDAMTYQEKLKDQENQIADDEFQQRQRIANYEFQARSQDEAIASMEFKANQKLLETMQKR
jgi:hypothetical protein